MRPRRATEDDASAIASINVRAWQAAFRGLVDQAYLDSLVAEDRAVQWSQWMRDRPETVHIWVVEEQRRVVGYASVGPSRDEDADPSTGELYAIYLEPSLVGTGRGRELLRHAEEDLRAQGYRNAILWTLPGNGRARRVYEAAGWQADGAEKVGLFDGVPIEEVRYRLEL
jgi:GNAT superfamily N-acetyltransferase